MMPIRTLAVAACLLCRCVAADPMVAGVIDGDTVDLTDGRRIRLAGVDAPERGQAYAVEAWGHLARRVAGLTVTVEPRKTDKYGRTVARLLVDGQDVGLALLRAGAAWHFVRYAHEQPDDERLRYSEAEAEAHRARVGLWTEASPVAPWLVRHPEQATRLVSPPAQRAATADCTVRKRCRQIASCEEAMDYLIRCSRLDLDGDRDGVPCEALCGGVR